MFEAQTTAQALKSVGLVAGAVIGQHTLKPDLKTGVVAHRVHQSLTGTFSRLILMERAEGDATMVINGHMDILPARPSALLLSIASHPMPRALKASKLLDVQM